MSHFNRDRNVLMRGGQADVSFYDDPAPSWASHIHWLRERGLLIRTCREPHSGRFPGHRARYFLETSVVELPPALRRSLAPLQPVAKKADTTPPDYWPPVPFRPSG